MKINVIKFLVKSPLIISMVILFVAIACLYVLAALPAINRTREASLKLEEKRAEMERFLANPPSRERITRLGEQKEMLATQYLEVAKKMGFFRPDPLPNFPAHFDGMEMKPLLASFGTRVLHDYFEKELVSREIRLRHLGERHRLTIPSRLGFKEERPETPQALALLLAGVASVETLLTIAMNAGVNEFSSIEAPSPPYKEGITPDFKELNIGLVMKTDALALIKFLDYLTTGEHFFIIEGIEVVSTPAHLEVKLSISTQIFLKEEI
jgi:hypothetical protein